MCAHHSQRSPGCADALVTCMHEKGRFPCGHFHACIGSAIPHASVVRAAAPSPSHPRVVSPVLRLTSRACASRMRLTHAPHACVSRTPLAALSQRDGLSPPFRRPARCHASAAWPTKWLAAWHPAYYCPTTDRCRNCCCSGGSSAPAHHRLFRHPGPASRRHPRQPHHAPLTPVRPPARGRHWTRAAPRQRQRRV